MPRPALGRGAAEAGGDEEGAAAQGCKDRATPPPPPADSWPAAAQQPAYAAALARRSPGPPRPPQRDDAGAQHHLQRLAEHKGPALHRPAQDQVDRAAFDLAGQAVRGPCDDKGRPQADKERVQPRKSQVVPHAKTRLHVGRQLEQRPQPRRERAHDAGHRLRPADRRKARRHQPVKGPRRHGKPEQREPLAPQCAPENQRHIAKVMPHAASRCCLVGGRIFGPIVLQEDILQRRRLDRNVGDRQRRQQPQRGERIAGQRTASAPPCCVSPLIAARPSSARSTAACVPRHLHRDAPLQVCAQVVDARPPSPACPLRIRAHPVTQLLNLAEDVRGEEDRRAALLAPSRSRSNSARFASGSNPSVGSSRMINPGRCCSPCTMLIFWRVPRESLPIGRLQVLRPEFERVDQLLPIHRRPALQPRQLVKQPEPRCRQDPAQPRPGQNPTRPRACHAAFGSAISWPSSCTDPALGRKKPSSSRMVVVFPAPLGPKKPITSPSATRRLRSVTAA